MNWVIDGAVPPTFSTRPPDTTGPVTEPVRVTPGTLRTDPAVVPRPSAVDPNGTVPLLSNGARAGRTDDARQRVDRKVLTGVEGRRRGDGDRLRQRGRGEPAAVRRLPDDGVDAGADGREATGGHRDRGRLEDAA